jgi:hypothetical protein
MCGTPAGSMDFKVLHAAPALFIPHPRPALIARPDAEIELFKRRSHYGFPLP